MVCISVSWISYINCRLRSFLVNEFWTWSRRCSKRTPLTVCSLDYAHRFSTYNRTHSASHKLHFDFVPWCSSSSPYKFASKTREDACDLPERFSTLLCDWGTCRSCITKIHKLDQVLIVRWYRLCISFLNRLIVTWIHYWIESNRLSPDVEVTGKKIFGANLC